MDIIEAVKLRKSIRGYKPDPVSKEILGEILEIATRAPSGLNIQPWEFYILAGEVLNKVRQTAVEMVGSGVEPNPDIPYSQITGVYKERQVALAIQLFGLMGITREDRDKRAEWTKKGFRFFDAPAAIIICKDKSLGVRTGLNIGIITQTICLVALSYGLGTCIEGQGIMYPSVLRELVGIPESKLIVTSISIGYPDWNFPANKLESKRESYENITTWCGF